MSDKFIKINSAIFNINKIVYVFKQDDSIVVGFRNSKYGSSSLVFQFPNKVLLDSAFDAINIQLDVFELKTATSIKKGEDNLIFPIEFLNENIQRS